MRKTLTDAEYDFLTWSLGQGECVLFLGPGVGVIRDGEPQNVSLELAKRLAAAMDEEVPPTASLSDVAHRYEQRFRRGKLLHEVESFYKGLDADPSDERFAALASLPFRLIVTTRHDPVFVQHLRAAGKNPDLRCFDFAKVDDDTSFEEGTADEPIVYHLFGQLGEGSLIITEGDIHNMLTRLGTESSRLPAGLKSAVKNKLLLLAGFGVRQWQTRFLLSDLGASDEGQYQSFAIDEFGRFLRATDHEAANFFDKKFAIETLLGDGREILPEVHRRWAAKAPAEDGDSTETKTNGGASVEPRREPRVSARGARVFLSYRHEDKPRAVEIYEEMEREGLRPFRDEVGLEAGVNWEQVLKQQVEDADYFVLLWSSGLASADETYVGIELDYALRRNKKFTISQKKFLIPFLIEEGLTLPAVLSDVQGRATTNAEEIRKEVRELKRDYERRKRDES